MVNINKNKKKIILIIGILIGVLSLIYLYSLHFLFGYNLSPTNIMYAFSPWNSEHVNIWGPLLSDPADSILPQLYDIYHNGHFGLWDNTISLGQITDLWLCVYPLNWLYFLSFAHAVIIKSILEFLIALFSMYLFITSLGIEKRASIIGAVIYTFSAVMVVWHFWPHSDVAAFAPLLFYFMRRMILEDKYLCIVGLGYIEGIMLLAGMPTYVAYFDYLLGFYFLYLVFKNDKTNWRKALKHSLMFILSIGIGILISSPYLLGVVESTISTGYSASRSNQSAAVLDIKYLLTMIFPFAKQEEVHFNECTMFVGILPILLFPTFFLGIKRKQNKDYLYWFISFVVLILLLFTHILDFVYMRMPAINTSLKIRIIVLICFVLPIISSICLEDIILNYKHYKKYWYILLPIYVIVLCGYFFLRRIYPDYVLLKKTDFVVLFSLLLLFVSFIKKNKLCIFGLLLLVIFNGTSVAKQYFPYVSKDGEIVPEPTDSIEFLQKEASNSTVLVLGDSWTFFPNTNGYYGLHLLSGHSLGLTSPDYTLYFQGICAESYQTPTRVQFTSIDNYNLLKYLGVQYIAVNRDYIQNTGQDLSNSSNTMLVYSGDDGIDVYQLLDSSNRFEYATDVYVHSNKNEMLKSMENTYTPNGIHLLESSSDYFIDNDSNQKKDIAQQDRNKISIIDESRDCISLETTNQQTEYLVFNEYYDENWKVYVNGKEEELLQCNYLTRAVLLHEGENFVEFKYENDTIYLLLVISGCTIIITSTSSILILVRKKKGKK